MPPQGRKSAEEILGLQPAPRRRSAEEILGITPRPPVAAEPQQRVFDSFATELAGTFLRYGIKPAAALGDALNQALNAGNFEPLKNIAESAGRGALNIASAFDPAGAAYEPTVASQAPRLQELSQAREARTPETLRLMERGYQVEAAKPRTTAGKVAGVVGGLVGAGAPVIATGVLTGGSLPAVATAAALQSAAEPENLALNVGAAVTPLPVGKLVAPILRRIRGARGLEAEAAGFPVEAPRPSPSLAKAIGQDAFDDTRIAVEELGLARVPQPTRPVDAFPVRREIPVDSITLSRDSLSRGRMYQAQEGLKEGVKGEGETFTTLGGKQRPVDPIQVVPDPQNLGRFIVEGDGNHRVALLKLQGANQLVPVKSFETQAQSAALNQSVGQSVPGAGLNLYHGTDRSFETFDFDRLSDDIGYHFGTEKAATDRIARIAQEGRPGGKIQSFSVDIKNPVEVSDYGRNNWNALARDLEKKGIVSEADMQAYERINRQAAEGVLPLLESGASEQEIMAALSASEDAARKTIFSDLRAKVLKSGYDGLKYSNEYEDIGQMSYVALRPQQVQRHVSESVLNAENYYRPLTSLPTLEAVPPAPFGVSLGKQRAPKPGAAGPRINEYGFVEGSSPGVVTAAERTPILKTIVALVKAGWLSRPNTHLKNLGFNAGFALSEEAARVPAAIADIVVSPIFGGGRRTITGPSAGAMARSLKEAVTKGLSEAKQVIKNGITDADAERLALKELNSPSKVLNAWVNYNFRFLSAEDKVFHAYAARRALEDRARSIALTEAHAGEITRGQIGQRTRELIQNPPEALAGAVTADAEIAVFQNENLLSGYLKKGREFLEATGTRKGRLASAGTEMVLPFPKTPTNVIGLMLEYAGGGYLKNIGQAAKAIANKGMTEAEQRAFSQSFGRGSIGLPLIVLGSILYKKGLMTGYVEDDPTRKARDEAAGRIPGAVLIGDTWHQVVGSSPFGNLMTIGATIQRESDQERDDALKAYTEAAARFVGEQPLMTGAKQLTAPLNQPGTFVSRTVGGFAGGLVPGLVSDVAQTFDSTRRQSDTVYRQVAGRIPGLRNTLPERPDVLGRSVPLPIAFDPTKSTTAQQLTNPLMAELVRLDQGISGFEKKKNESDEAYAEKVRTFGQLYGQYGLSLINSPSYKNQDDVAKQEIFDLFNQRLKTLITENQERFANAKLSPPVLLQAFRESQLRKLQKRNQRP